MSFQAELTSRSWNERSSGRSRAHTGVASDASLTLKAIRIASRGHGERNNVIPTVLGPGHQVGGPARDDSERHIPGAKYGVPRRPFADPEKAARRILEIANTPF
jgi:hypothetical protein